LLFACFSKKKKNVDQFADAIVTTIITASKQKTDDQRFVAGIQSNACICRAKPEEF
jgi:hypothetical protein